MYDLVHTYNGVIVRVYVRTYVTAHGCCECVQSHVYTVCLRVTYKPYHHSVCCVPSYIHTRTFVTACEVNHIQSGLFIGDRLLALQSSLEQLSVQKDLLLSKLSEAEKNNHKLRQQLVEKEAQAAQKEVSLMQCRSVCVCMCACVCVVCSEIIYLHTCCVKAVCVYCLYIRTYVHV